MSRIRLARICGRCNEVVRPGDAPCPRCGPDTTMKRGDGVQIGMIDGEQIGYFPPEAGPYANPGKSIKRVLKNNAAWREMVKRSEGRIGDIS